MPTWTTGGYNFPNYTPTPTPTPDPAPEITAGQRLQAKRAGASHLAFDGYYCYRWNNGKLESKQWYNDHYSMNWLNTGKVALPEGAVKVDG
jgi:hypothetical protein